MCTVTFIPVNNKVYITSNRDEKWQRKQAIPPRFYSCENITLVYPRDADAGGSWIAMRDNGNAAVLLNGAFQKHLSNPPYKKSRGTVFLELIKGDNPVKKFRINDLLNIEPFTVIIFHQNNLYECRWDGTKKYCTHLQNDKPYIWSSATLYDPEVASKREQWFFKWLQQNPLPAQNDILHFHQFTGEGDKRNDLVMNRDGKLFTVSITQIQLDQDNGRMRYLDFKDGSTHSAELPLLTGDTVI